jgi:hypothetical protein
VRETRPHSACFSRNARDRLTESKFRKTIAAGTEAMKCLTTASTRCQDAAQAQSSPLNDNHVGTEHIVLSVLATPIRVEGRDGLADAMPSWTGMHS